MDRKPEPRNGKRETRERPPQTWLQQCAQLGAIVKAQCIYAQADLRFFEPDPQFKGALRPNS